MQAHLLCSIQRTHDRDEAQAGDIERMTFIELLHRSALAHQHRAELLEIVERLRRSVTAKRLRQAGEGLGVAGCFPCVSAYPVLTRYSKESWKIA